MEGKLVRLKVFKQIFYTELGLQIFFFERRIMLLEI